MGGGEGVDVKSLLPHDPLLLPIIPSLVDIRSSLDQHSHHLHMILL